MPTYIPRISFGEKGGHGRTLFPKAADQKSNRHNGHGGPRWEWQKAWTWLTPRSDVHGASIPDEKYAHSQEEDRRYSVILALGFFHLLPRVEVMGSHLHVIAQFRVELYAKSLVIRTRRSRVLSA